MTKAKMDSEVFKGSIIVPRKKTGKAAKAAKVSKTARKKEKKLKPHTRVLGSWLSPFEKPTLLWMAARLPAWMTPDVLTFIGIFGSLLILTGYCLTLVNKYFLLLASFGFALNWFGDSLDGTVARFRKIERPKYGFFVDHSVDAINEVCIFVGVGISPFAQFTIAMLALAGYLLMSVNVFLTTYVTGEFRLSYAKLGPTEARVLAIAANMFVMFAVVPSLSVFGLQLTAIDFLGLLIASVAYVSFIMTTIKTSLKLAKVDKPGGKE